jgi:hypothetical protein
MEYDVFLCQISGGELCTKVECHKMKNTVRSMKLKANMMWSFKYLNMHYVIKTILLDKGAER